MKRQAARFQEKRVLKRERKISRWPFAFFYLRWTSNSPLHPSRWRNRGIRGFDGAWKNIRGNVIMRIVSEMRVTVGRFRAEQHEIFRSCLREGIQFQSVVQHVIKIRVNSCNVSSKTIVFVEFLTVRNPTRSLPRRRTDLREKVHKVNGWSYRFFHKKKKKERKKKGDRSVRSKFILFVPIPVSSFYSRNMSFQVLPDADRKMFHEK